MMQQIKRTVTALAILMMTGHSVDAQDASVTVSFDTVATVFTESLPLGNGRLGAMMYGNVRKERIALNEISLWSGGKQDADREDAYQYLKPIQELLLAGRNREAQALLQKHFIARGDGSGYGRGANAKYGCYQALGDLFITWKDSSAPVTGYARKLDIEKASAVTEFTRNGQKFKEEMFADFTNDIIWIRLSSSQQKGIHVRLSLYRKENAAISAETNSLVMRGQLPFEKEQGMRFATVVTPVVKDGRVRTEGNELLIEDASECWIKVAAATNYNWKTAALNNADPVDACLSNIRSTTGTAYTTAAGMSTKKYQQYFNRCRWQMPGNSAVAVLTTPQRLLRYWKGEEDLQLPVLYFNFGRYLLISSSRPGLLPANLQGLWATEYQTPWNGDYHLNINIQMNYWPAEPTNLADLAEPLHRFTKDLVAPGEKTAKAYYNAKGWTAHVISNPWRFTSPGEGAQWGSTITGGAWLCEHIWEHYRFTNDTSFLRTYFPVLKAAALFLQSVLIKEPKHSWLVTAPSNSPENTYTMPDGFRGQTAMGPAIDMQICRELFNACIKAAAVLKTDETWSKELQQVLPQLAPNQVGGAGDLNEWLDDWKDAEPRHRHVSHLYGLYPYDEISVAKTPELAKAAKQTLLDRGDDGTGWSKAWKINFWARLGDGNHALVLLKQLLKPVVRMGIEMSGGGGTYANLFCAHPPFQIDGNFGGTAGIAEMLIQSQEAYIKLLPALPDAWQASGTIKGLCARGGFVIDMAWKDGRITDCSVYSGNGGECKLMVNNKLISLQTTKGKSQKLDL